MINLQPSQADRWMNCPASAMLLKGSSEYVASGQPMSRDLPEYTAEGTTAHELAKVKLQRLLQNQPMPHVLITKLIANTVFKLNCTHN